MRRDGFITHIFLAGVRGVVRGADRSIGRWAMPAGLAGVPNPYFSFPSFPVFGGGPNGWGKTWEWLSYRLSLLRSGNHLFIFIYLYYLYILRVLLCQ